MTPQEKAKELFDKYIYYVEAFDEVSQVKNAKYCSLICVNEMLKRITEDVHYWHQVKEELEKL